jgi:glycosyltransferase 2 family protein
MTVSRTQRRLVIAAAWLLLTVAIIIVGREMPWRRTMATLATQKPWWAAIAVLANLAILPLWAAEWVRLAPARERPGFRTTFGIVALVSSTLNTIPFFVGEASAVVLLVARAGLSRAGALSVLALDQLLVGVAKLVVVATAALVSPLPLWLRGGVAGLAFTVILVGATLVVLARIGSDRLRTAPSPVRRRVAAWSSHLEVLRDARRSASVMMLAFLKKAAEIIAIVAVQQALSVQLPWWSAIAVVAALGIGTLVPVAPGNIGTYEAIAYVVYRSLGLTSEASLALAVVQHLYFLIPAVGTGWLLLTLRSGGIALGGTSDRPGGVTPVTRS